MHEMQIVVTDVHNVCPSVCLSHDSTWLQSQGSFDAVFAKSLWPRYNFMFTFRAYFCMFVNASLGLPYSYK